MLSERETRKKRIDQGLMGSVDLRFYRTTSPPLSYGRLRRNSYTDRAGLS